MALWSKIKQKIADHFIKIAVKNKRAVQFPNMQKPLEFLLVFESDEDEKNEEIRSMIQLLKKDNHKVSALGYLNKKELKSLQLPNFEIFGKKETQFIGLPTQEVLNGVAQRKYDVAILLAKKNMFLDCLFSQVNSKFKISQSNKYKGLSDFIIEVDSKKDTKYFFEQVLFYLNSIETKY